MNMEPAAAGRPNPPPLPQPVAYRTAPDPDPADDPANRETVHGFTGMIEAILRQPLRVVYTLHQPGAGRLTGTLFLAALMGALIYGVVVGTFSGGAQLWLAPLKVAGGLLAAALICLPSLYIFACLGGSQGRLAELAGLLGGLLVLTVLLLIGFAPVAWLFSASTNSIGWMGFLHLVFLGISLAFGLRFLFTGVACLKARSAGGLVAWSIIFILVVLQMTTTLRPILGTADTRLPTEKKFFLKHWADTLSAPAPAKK